MAFFLIIKYKNMGKEMIQACIDLLCSINREEEDVLRDDEISRDTQVLQAVISILEHCKDGEINKKK